MSASPLVLPPVLPPVPPLASPLAGAPPAGALHVTQTTSKSPADKISSRTSARAFGPPSGNCIGANARVARPHSRLLSARSQGLHELVLALAAADPDPDPEGLAALRREALTSEAAGGKSSGAAAARTSSRWRATPASASTERGSACGDMSSLWWSLMNAVVRSSAVSNAPWPASRRRKATLDGRPASCVRDSASLSPARAAGLSGPHTTSFATMGS
mmetsp:Transcript_42312/g.126842  ORF Transcript_42312/g.126842 Transcript_42312/m.126842 type:complete len:217 (-) Transcript_42312:2517-3167(-)